MHLSTVSLRACSSAPVTSVDVESQHILRAVELADKSAGLTAPHPNAGCVLVRGSQIVGEGFFYAQGSRCAELQAVEKAGELARGATAYLNLEPGDCHGDDAAVAALTQAGVSRVVVGLRHPFEHFRGEAIKALRRSSTRVDVLGEDLQGHSIEEALKACQVVNAPSIFRATRRIPFSVLKYAMTLDGKIAASTGHAAWVSSKQSRQRVFETRSRSDAVIVGGNTVRRDNPRLTTRQDGGHLPVRIVMSRCLHLPEELNLWDVSTIPTIVMTQKGARRDFQAKLASRGVEVVEFDFLTPREVMEYCYQRGFLSVLWECGGTLAAPAIGSGVIHKIIAFVAPKIIGGATAPTPVGDLGMVEMTQALNLVDVSFEQTGPDMLIAGYLEPIPDIRPSVPFFVEAGSGLHHGGRSSFERPSVIYFYKAWDPFGAFSNFSSHPITVSSRSGNAEQWKSVEHYYQAQKYAGVDNPIALDAIKNVQKAKSPEEAARVGRTTARQHPHAVSSDWESKKLSVMYTALQCKFSSYPALESLLRSTGQAILAESSPHDFFWGTGRDGTGYNHLGRLLMQLRSELESKGSLDAKSIPVPVEAGSAAA